ncbi:MAG: YfiR family protein [Mariprofundus sp.]
MLLCSVCAVTTSYANGLKAGVSDLKAAYMFNFIRFTDWPEQAGAKRSAAITLQVLGDSAIMATMHSIAEKPVAQQIGLDVQSCVTATCIGQSSALFIGKEERDYQQLLAQLKGKPVLTISDIQGFAARGGMIEIRYQDTKLTFIVNLQAVERAGLYISAQLLQLGEIIGRDHE